MCQDIQLPAAGGRRGVGSPGAGGHPTYIFAPLLEADQALLHAPRGQELADILDLDGVRGFLSQAQQTELKG